MTDAERIHFLIQSNDELRAVLICAGKELGKRKLKGKPYVALMNLLRRTLREARAVVKVAKAAQT